jgi:predicted Zn-dependent protease
MLLTAAWLLLSGCQLVSLPQQQAALTEPQEHRHAARVYRELLAAHPPSQHQEYVQLVEQAGKHLARAADRPHWQWEFAVVALGPPRVIALPGGKVVVTEGGLAGCRNEAEIAAVLAHEMGHILARHGAERWRQAADAASKESEGAPSTDRQFRLAYGATFHGAAPHHDAVQEAEADSIGLLLLAKAGYDPKIAVAMWSPVPQAGRAGVPAEAAGALGAQNDRGRHLQDVLPQAVAIYSGSTEKRGEGALITGRPTPAASKSAAPTAVAAGPGAASHIAAHAPSGGWSSHGSTKPEGWNRDLEDPEWYQPALTDAGGREHAWAIPIRRTP